MCVYVYLCYIAIGIHLKMRVHMYMYLFNRLKAFNLIDRFDEKKKNNKTIIALRFNFRSR